MQPLTEQLGNQRRTLQFALLQIEDLYTQAPRYAIQGATTLLARMSKSG